MKNQKFSSLELEVLCRNNGFKADNSPYVLDFEMSPMRVLFSQNDLLGLLSVSQNLQIVGTYRLTLYGFPVIVVDIQIMIESLFVQPYVLLKTKITKLYHGS